MPVTCPIQFRQLTEQGFRETDYKVMAHAFASHNELGRLCDEDIYKADLAARVSTAGFGPVRREVPLVISWRDFRKRYFLDLVVEDGLVYELKAATMLVGEHQAQMLNYLLVLGLHHGKVVNFRPPSLQWRFVSTTLTPEERRRWKLYDTHWREVSASCSKLRSALLELLADWGAFLELPLYEEALIWFLGGQAQIVQRGELARNGVPLGTQRMLLHGPGVGFKLTATTDHQQQVHAHLARFLALTDLKALQWINFNHFQIELTTLFQR